MSKKQISLFICKIFLNCLVHFIAFFIALGLATASDLGCDLAYFITSNELFACIILEIAVCFFAYKIHAYKKLDNKIMIIIYWAISIMQSIDYFLGCLGFACGFRVLSFLLEILSWLL